MSNVISIFTKDARGVRGDQEPVQGAGAAVGPPEPREAAAVGAAAAGDRVARGDGGDEEAAGAAEAGAGGAAAGLLGQVGGGGRAARGGRGREEEAGAECGRLDGAAGGGGADAAEVSAGEASLRE